MKTTTKYYQNNELIETKEHQTKKDAINYKKNILNSFTPHQKVKNNISLTIN